MYLCIYVYYIQLYNYINLQLYLQRNCCKIYLANKMLKSNQNWLICRKVINQKFVNTPWFTPFESIYFGLKKYNS